MNPFRAATFVQVAAAVLWAAAPATAQTSGPQPPFQSVQITPTGEFLVLDAQGAFLCALDMSGAAEVVYDACRPIVSRDDGADDRAVEAADAAAGGGGLDRIEALTEAYIETLSGDPFLIGAAFTNLLRANGCSIEPSGYPSEDDLLAELFTELAPVTGLDPFPFPFSEADLPDADETQYGDIVDRMQPAFAQGYVAMLSMGTITLENDVLSLTVGCP